MRGAAGSTSVVEGPLDALRPGLSARAGHHPHRLGYYAVRCGYGLVLLFGLALCGQAFTSDLSRRPGGPATVTIREMAEFGAGMFSTFATVQGIAILLLTPALIAGVIADERQRKTLYYLLASRLTSGEIVLGKLASRLLHVGVFLALGLPILSLLTLFGGVNPRVILLTYAGTASTAIFLAGLSVLVSTTSRGRAMPSRKSTCSSSPGCSCR